MFVVLLALIANTLAQAPQIPQAVALAPQLENLAQEYRYSTGLSTSGDDRLSELSEYLREKVQGFDAVYALIDVQSGSYRLTIGDFLRNPASIDIEATGSTPSSASGSLSDRETDNWEFAATGNVHLTIVYTFQDAAYSQELSFDASRNQTIGWFDIGIRSDGNNLRRSGIWNVTK